MPVDLLDISEIFVDGAIFSPGFIVPVILLIIGLLFFFIGSNDCKDACEKLGYTYTTEYDHCLCVNEDGLLIDPYK